MCQTPSGLSDQPFAHEAPGARGEVFRPPLPVQVAMAAGPTATSSGAMSPNAARARCASSITKVFPRRDSSLRKLLSAE